MIDRTVVLTGARVRLEPLSERHIDELRIAGNDDALWEFTYQGNPFANDADTKAWLQDALIEGDRLTFAIVDAESGSVIGSTRFADIEPRHRKLEIGWTFISRNYWRTGVNTECKYLLLQFAFERWNATRVQFKAQAVNHRSRTAIEGIGATYEGTLRHFRILPKTGVACDTSFYSIIAPEWPAVKTRLASRLHADLRTA